jgi:hypothetical protein
MENPIYIGLLENTAILIVVAVIYDFIWLKADKSRKLPLQALLGLLIGGIGIILMKSPWTLVGGIVFDTRSVLLTISGLFFGGITTLIAMAIMFVYRLSMGGTGAYMGIAVITSSALIGLIWRKVRPKIIKERNLGEVYLVSFIVHLVMLSCTIFLPKESRMQTLKVIWWPVLLIYPLATTLIAKLLFKREENWNNREKLAENEEKYRLLFENNPNPMWIYDLETLNFLEVNRAAIEHYGYTREEFLAMTLKDIRPQEDIPKLLENIETHNDTYQTSGNWRHRKKNGEIIYVQIASHGTIFNGRHARLVTVNDVTELIESHSIISQKEKEFREIFNSGFDSIQIDDIDSEKIIDCNDITLQMYGYTKDEILNGNIADLSANIPPYDEDNAKRYIKKAIEGESQNFEWLARKKNGETFWVNVRLKLVEIEGVKRVMAIVRDITERKKNEQNLIESEQRFLRVMHFSKDAIGILDENFYFIDCNDSAARLHGYKSRMELLKNSPHPSTLSPQTQPCGNSSYELANKMIEIALEQGFNKFEWLHKKVNGQKFWAEVSLTPIVFNGKRVIYGVWRDISDQKNKQNRIERLIKILDESINEVYIFRCDNLRFIEFNKTAVSNVGYSTEELLELTPFHLKPYLTAEKFNELIKPLNDGTSSKIFFETIHRRKNGTEYPVEVYIEKTKVSDIDAYSAIVLDISQRKKYLTELKQREHELHEIFDSTLEAILIYEIESGKIVDCNRQTQTLYGYNKDELIGKPLGVLNANVEKYNAAEATKWAEKALTVGPQTYTWLGKKKSGETFWVEISLKKSRIGGVDMLMAVVRDITERFAQQREIERREKEFREIFNATAEAILIYDPLANQIVDCNNRAVEIYGYGSKKEFLSCKLDALGANVEPFTNDKVGYYSQKAAEEGPQRFDWLAKRKNGEHFWIEVSLRLTKIGGVKRELIVIRDIADRKKFENDLVMAKEKAEESDRLKSAFLANLSHEIRTPMNAIMGFSDLLKLPVDEKKRNEYIETIQKSGYRLLDIISETIEIAKLDTGLIKTNPETFNLDQLMQDIYNELKIKVAGNKELELIYLPHESTTETTLYTDRVKLQQILTNLITNGIKYTPRGAVAFGYEIKDNRVIFRVKDTGIGIERKNRELVFKRFYRVDNPLTMKVSGIGLGLSIAKAYTELLGGTIELESELGRGTSVTISLPYIKGEPQTEIFVEIPPEKLQGENELILVAEDDEYNFMYINEILKQFKYTCLRAANGQEAVELAQKNSNIRLILMDLKMPIMDGYQAFEQIRSFNPHLPIVAQTAYALGEDMQKIKSYGFDGYIRKPIRKEELLSVVSEKVKRELKDKG